MFHCFVCLLSFGLGKVMSCFYGFFRITSFASRSSRTERSTSQDFHRESVDITLPETNSFLAPEIRLKLHPQKEFSSGQVLHKKSQSFLFRNHLRCQCKTKTQKQQIAKLNYDSKATSLYQNLRLSVRFLHLHFSNIHDSKMHVFFVKWIYLKVCGWIIHATWKDFWYALGPSRICWIEMLGWQITEPHTLQVSAGHVFKTHHEHTNNIKQLKIKTTLGSCGNSLTPSHFTIILIHWDGYRKQHLGYVGQLLVLRLGVFRRFHGTTDLSVSW